jgi:5-methylcytosine-specific restriction endonuclease McrA
MTPEEKKERYKIYRRRYRENNKDKVRESNKKYHEKNKDKIKQKGKKYREKNKDKIKQNGKEYREKNKEKIQQRMNKYLKENIDKVRIRSREYQRKRRLNKTINDIIIEKIYSFHKRAVKLLNQYNKQSISIHKIINKKIKTMKSSSKIEVKFTTEDFLNKIGDNPKCYLTGRDIDLSGSRLWNIDHVMPLAKGGDNSLDNCNITCRDANMSKSDMTLDEYLKLCKEVLENFGYKVTDPSN